MNKQAKFLNLNLIISVLVIIILLAFIFTFNLFGLGTLTNNGINAVISVIFGIKITLNTVSCPDFIIPEKMIIIEEPVRKEIMNTWKDGTAIAFFPSDPWDAVGKTLLEGACRLGNIEGENKNYYYCDYLNYVKNSQGIDSKGNILGNLIYNYSLNLILKPEGNWTILKEPPMLERGMMTEEEVRLLEEDISNFPVLFSQVMGRYRTYSLGASYVYGQKEKWVQINGEVWIDNAPDSFKTPSIYRNYSVLSSTCIKN